MDAERMDAGIEEPRRKFTADEVLHMVRAGILDEDDRVELIDGELLVNPPQEPPHASSVDRLTERVVKAYTGRYRVRVGLPLAASAKDLPEPDLAVVRGSDREFETRHPGGSDTVLVIEVSWSTRRRDRRKASIYAAAGVPVYWRLDLESRRLEVHEKPSPDGTYALVRSLDETASVEVPDTSTSWRISDLLPLR